MSVGKPCKHSVLFSCVACLWLCRDRKKHKGRREQTTNNKTLLSSSIICAFKKGCDVTCQVPNLRGADEMLLSATDLFAIVHCFASLTILKVRPMLKWINFTFFLMAIPSSEFIVSVISFISPSMQHVVCIANRLIQLGLLEGFEGYIVIDTLKHFIFFLVRSNQLPP